MRKKNECQKCPRIPGVDRKSTARRRRHLKLLAGAFSCWVNPHAESIEKFDRIPIEEIWWWLEQAGMDSEFHPGEKFTEIEVEDFARIAESMLYGYIGRLKPSRQL